MTFTLFGGVGYRQKQPYIDLILPDGIIEAHSPYDLHDVSFALDTRYCIGWYDMATRARHACPESAVTDSKYDTCPACQNRTGFNPAFYHATSISSQQEKRNAEPHAVYLAHFGEGVTKVGIAHAIRVYDRLLEQGARHAYILETAPTALIARDHEAKIANMPTIRESVQAAQKQRLMTRPLDAIKARQELDEHIQNIASELRLTFDKPEYIALDSFYFPSGSTPVLTDIDDISDQAKMAGTPIGLIGTIAINDYEGRLVLSNLKKYTGYHMSQSNTPLILDLPPQQASLF